MLRLTPYLCINPHYIVSYYIVRRRFDELRLRMCDRREHVIPHKPEKGLDIYVIEREILSALADDEASIKPQSGAKP